MIRLSQIPTAEQAQAIIEAGAGAIVQHARAGSRKGRGRILRQLGALGVPGKIVKTIGWVTSDGRSVTPEQRAKDDPAES